MARLTALLDSDTPIFSAAVSSDTEWKAKSRLDTMIERIIVDSGCDDYILYVSGDTNFRKTIDPLYKANRPPDDPEFRKLCRQHLIDNWNTVVANDCEADDLVGVNQTEDTIICGIDKDLLMIAGRHYQWPIVRSGKVLRPKTFYTIDINTGMKEFFVQALTGDKSDNIMYRLDPVSNTWKKKKWALGAKAAERYLEDIETEADLYNAVRTYYLDNCTEDDIEAELKKNLDLLWIWRNLGETYSIRQEVRG